MFPSLFSPLQIGPIQIKNRIQITPHELQYMEDGLASDTLLNYFVERAKGGVGLSELSQLMIKPAFGVYLADWKYDSAQRFPIQSTPDIIPGLKTLTEGVHKFESKIFMEVSAWTWLYGPVSSMPFESGIELRELDVSEIRQIEEDFSRAAKFAKEAGFDGIDLHGTHGAMIEHFYSPATNLRTDRYGGTMENRMRFLFEVVDTVRSTIGDFIALGMRVCADEKIDGGVTPDYAARMASLFDGKIDFVNVGTGAAGYFEAANQTARQSEPLYTLPGYALSPAAEVKKVCKKTKVGAVGKILDPLMADDTIEKGFADYVGMTRALIADAELPRKAQSGQLEDIRPCIGTLQDCWGRSVAREWPMRCTVNPAVGREDERGIDKMTPAPRQKKVLIIGGGPAGLEAARVASERGHEVVIYEAGGVIGGQLNLAKLLPGRVDVGAISRWYEIQLQKRKNVRIELHKEVPEREDVVRYLAHDEKPDTVIISTGSTARKDGMQMITHRPMPGWDSSNVMSIDEVFSSKTQIQGRRVLVADSTTYVVGAGAAEWLSRNGATEVVLVTPHPHIAPELSGYNQLIYVLDRLNDAHVRIIPLSWIRRIDQERTFVFPISKPTIEEELPVDYVVLHTGRNHRGTLLKKLFQPLVSEVYEIGDCVVAGDTLRGAIESGYQIGSTI